MTGTDFAKSPVSEAVANEAITRYEQDHPQRITPGRWELVIETETGEFGSILSRYCEGIREATGQRRWVVRFDDDYSTNQWADALHIVNLHNAELAAMEMLS